MGRLSVSRGRVMIRDIVINVIVTLCNIAAADDCQVIYDIRNAPEIGTHRQCLDTAVIRAEAWAERNKPGYYVTEARCVITQAQGV